jgi:hypothetical protein
VSVDYWGMEFVGIRGLLRYGIRWCKWVTGIKG